MINRVPKDLETHAKYWQLKIKVAVIIGQMYEFLGGDHCPHFSVPATFILTELLFHSLPHFLFNTFVLQQQPQIYSYLFSAVMQIRASAPITLYKEKFNNGEQLPNHEIVETNWTDKDLEAYTEYWQIKAKSFATLGCMYQFLGGDQYATFAVPATFILADLLFKALPCAIFNKYALDQEPTLYSNIFRVMVQLTISLPIVIYKNTIQNMKQQHSPHDPSSAYKGPFNV